MTDDKYHGFATAEEYQKAKQAEIDRALDDKEPRYIQQYGRAYRPTGRIANQHPEMQELPEGKARRVVALSAAFAMQSIHAASVMAQLDLEARNMGARVDGDTIDFTGTEITHKQELLKQYEAMHAGTLELKTTSIDYSDLERMAAQMEANAYITDTPLSAADFNALRQQRIPVSGKSVYIEEYGNQPNYGGRWRAQEGKHVKALAKRRAKNKQARKARRK